jgi:hypothetical protein
MPQPRPLTLLVAQSDPGAASNAPVAFNEMLPWLVIPVVLAVAGALLIVYLRKRIFADEAADQPVGMMADLRAMRSRGELSDDEYERARAVMIARATGKDPDQVRADSIRKQGGLVAEPGFDLTGRPLPAPPPGPRGDPPPGPRPRG